VEQRSTVPSVSPKQRRFMAAAAHDAQFAARAGIDQDVAREFNDADQTRGRRTNAMTRGRPRREKNSLTQR
jgi:hypothetical protein